MRHWRIALGCLWGLWSLLSLWVLFYTLLDNLAFHLSITYIPFASYKMVQQMFVAGILISLLIALGLSVIFLVFFFIARKRFLQLNVAYALVQVLILLYIWQTDNFIPFLREIV
ncbi:hypothetical protein ACX93W_27010 [Paenibacillus sp. CAU 1782]